MKRICVNCGSNPGFDPIYLAMARRLGQVFVDRRIELIFGGAEVGLMGEVANTILKAGGSVIGVIPKPFAHKVSHRGLTQLHIVDSMHDRKAMMFDLSDAFIALPGGFGTLEEIFELITWSQLGLHGKPCGIINVKSYFNGLLEFLDRSVDEGFIKQEHRDMILVEDTPESLLDRFKSYEVPNVEKWIGIKSRT